MIRMTPDISIGEDEIQVHFVRASGPGGQNVNKVATAAELRFDVRNSPTLPQGVKDRLASLAGGRMNDEGVVIIDARRFRSQRRNYEDALDRLAALIRQAAARPKVRRKTRPTAASRARRLEEKRQRGRIKGLRQARDLPE